MSDLNNEKTRVVLTDLEKQALLQKFLEEKRITKNINGKIPIIVDKEIVPLSYGQQGLWFLFQLDEGSTVYNRATVLRITGDLVPPVLEKAINRILKRHDVLRTSFQIHRDLPIQKIAQYKEIDLPLIELTYLPIGKRREKAIELIVEINHKPFSLSQESLIRQILYKLSDQEYIFLFSTHHVIFDGWSEEILIEELSKFYIAEINHQENHLPELSIQYSDYSFWQRNQIDSGKLASQLDYWNRKLSGVPMIELPHDYHRPTVQTYSGNNISITLDEEMTGNLKNLCIQNQITPFPVLLTAFFILLHVYSGQDDLVIGTPVAGRVEPETYSMIGNFINILPIRLRLSNNQSLMNIMDNVRLTVLEALSNQKIPFEKIIEDIQPERIQDRHPLFQILFNYENIPKRDLPQTSIHLTRMDLPTEISRYELTLEINEKCQLLECNFIFNSDLFQIKTIERMGSHYLKILRGLINEPNLKLDNLQILSNSEEFKILEGWNNNVVEYQTNCLIHKLIENQVAENPENIAIYSPSHSHGEILCTYEELNKKSNKLAHYLHKLGVGPEKSVGVSIERSPEMIVGILGILKAGGAYVPLDPTYPVERLSFMVQNANIDLVVTQESLQPVFSSRLAKKVMIDSDWGKIEIENDENPSYTVEPENLAYIMFTSGSTGLPKGIMVDHKALVNYSKFRQAYFNLTQICRFLQFSTISFDLSIAEIFPTLMSGSGLVLRTEEMVNSIPAFFDTIEKFKITHMKLPTPFWHQICHELNEFDTSLPITLEWISIAGDRLINEFVIPWQRNNNEKIKLVNEYGPTETTGVSALYEFSINDKMEKPPPIGRPLPNEQIYILNRNLRPVPIGVTGEIFISGSGLARGYFDRRKLTAENFLPNPFIKTAGQRMYKTGDMARFLYDGTIEFLGRDDNQVKIRGFRVELGEIESNLIGHDEIQDALVLALDHPSGFKQLVAYIILSSKFNGDINKFQFYLTEKLPEYMVPRNYIFIDSFPLTPNGKINRKALPVPELSRPTLVSEYVSPKSPIEEILLSIWQEVLGIKDIGIDDNFFELGGHSLLVTQIISRIKHQFSLSISVREFFDSPTISKLARLIKK